MKRTISSAVLGKKANQSDEATSTPDKIGEEIETPEATVDPTSGFKPRMGGSGSAWKAGAQADTQALLNEKRAQLADNILKGGHELQLSGDQITDEIGSDRRDDWKDQAVFQSLRQSIELNGQDTPIQVWPVDPNWKPDALEPENVAGVPFILITGRRRHAILSELGRPIRAILADPNKRNSKDVMFEMLFMRFRENEERENLSAFERLISIGEMFKRLKAGQGGDGITASAFAKQIGVSESHVSRGNTIFRQKSKILHACKNVYDLSHRDLEKLLSDLNDAPKRDAKKPKKPTKLVVSRTVSGKKLSVASTGGKLSISASGLKLDRKALEELGDVVANYLERRKSSE